VMIQGSIKVQVPCETVFPYGALCLGVDKQLDFGKRGNGDDQARDKDTGLRVWVVRVTDLDPEAAKPGRTSEVKIKIAGAAGAAQAAAPERATGRGVRGSDPDALRRHGPLQWEFDPVLEPSGVQHPSHGHAGADRRRGRGGARP
jgi:hypothetical protein